MYYLHPTSHKFYNYKIYSGKKLLLLTKDIPTYSDYKYSFWKISNGSKLNLNFYDYKNRETSREELVHGEGLQKQT